jgi:hypothetical protein
MILFFLCSPHIAFSPMIRVSRSCKVRYSSSYVISVFHSIYFKAYCPIIIDLHDILFHTCSLSLYLIALFSYTVDMLLTLGILTFIIETYSMLFSLFKIFPFGSVLNVKDHISSKHKLSWSCFKTHMKGGSDCKSSHI